MTARGGSQSVPNKNKMEFRGRPLMLYPLMEASKVPLITELYITSDDESILQIGAPYARPIRRPQELRGDSSHYDVIMHGLKTIEEIEGEKLDAIVVLLGNTLGAQREELNEAICMLMEDNQATAIMSVSELSMYNPLRAHYEAAEGYTFPMANVGCQLATGDYPVNDKMACGPCMFFNGNFWIIKRKTLIDNEGPAPFSWLGDRLLTWKQDIYMEVDAPWQVHMLDYVYDNSVAEAKRQAGRASDLGKVEQLQGLGVPLRILGPVLP